MPGNKIIVLDFGGQTANLIARRIRQLGVYAEIALPDATTKKLKEAKGVILSGSPFSIAGSSEPDYNKEMFSLGIPLLGICYGMQLIAKDMGGKIGKCEKNEFGKAEMTLPNESVLFTATPEKQTVWMSHHDQVVKMPKEFELTGTTDICKIAAMAYDKKKIYGFQYHPEVAHTEYGMEMIANFVLDVCKCEKDWSMQGYLEKALAGIKEKVGEKKVLLLASGGVDSTVLLALLGMALPQEQVVALHVDTGLMRKNESEDVSRALHELELAELMVVDASKEFFKELKGVIDPEKKREIIGKLFLEITRSEVDKLDFDKENWILAQGTIYPDTIESARTKYSDKIKTHHNRIDELVKMADEGLVIEPLNELYKDEVRELGKLIGLSDELIWRHPFPGPGLGIRVLCSDGKKLLKKIEAEEKKAKKIAKKYNLDAAILPVKSVGVQGDMRTYRHPVMLSGELNWDQLEKCSIELTNTLNEVNRVVFLAGGEAKKIKPKKAFVDEERAQVCREADAIAHEIVLENNLQREIWQFPVIILPVEFNKGEAVVLRPITSTEAMTAEFYKMDSNVLKEITEKILNIDGVNAVLFDLTNKPPGTIEWE